MSEHEQLVQEVLAHAAVSLAQGSRPRAVVADLVERGVPEDAAQDIVGEANTYKKREFRKAGLEALAGGARTYTIAGPLGPKVLIYVGAVALVLFLALLPAP